jgi:hypothetical protein
LTVDENFKPIYLTTRPLRLARPLCLIVIVPPRDVKKSEKAKHGLRPAGENRLEVDSTSMIVIWATPPFQGKFNFGAADIIQIKRPISTK